MRLDKMEWNKWNGNVMKHVKEMWKWGEHKKIEEGKWGEWKWKMEGNECARGEKTWSDGPQPLRFKSQKMKLETQVIIDEIVNV